MKKLISGVFLFVLSLIFTFVPAYAASTILVTQINPQGWSTADTRTGGSVSYVNDTTSPYPNGALQLTTNSSKAAKAQYMHTTSTPLSDVTELSYSTKQVTASFNGGDASYQLPVYLTGTSGFTTLVYEPYENGTVVPGEWQTWDVDAGQFWSSRSVTCSNGAVVAGAGGAPFYTLEQIQTMCPEAVVIGFGVNIGSNNPDYVVETDGVNFNGTVYDFVYTHVPTSKDQCKNGGYVNYTDDQGSSSRNQGQCVSFFNHL